MVARPPSSSGSSSPADASPLNLSTTVCDPGRVCSTGLGPYTIPRRSSESGNPSRLRVQPQAQLGVDLREVREVALDAVGMIRPDLARELVAVDVRRAAVDERDAERRDGLGHVPRAGHVRLLRVVGLALGERATRLRREQEHLARPFREQLLEVRRPADVRGLDASAARLEPLELLAPRRVPVVREHHLLARVQSKLRQLCPDVPRSEDEQGLRAHAGMTLRREGAMLECEARTQGAFVAVGYGRDRGRRIAPSSAFSRHKASCRHAPFKCA